jgi:hypothetical protein
MEGAEAFAREAQETLATISNGYAADMQFGDGKEEINEWFEADINVRIMDNEARRAAAKGKAKQKRAEERHERKEAQQREDATLDYRRSKINMGKYLTNQ